MLLLPEALRDALLKYLMTRPCGEVIEGVNQLRALPKAPDADEPPKAD